MRTLKWLLVNHILRITKWNEFKYNMKSHKSIWQYALIGITFFILIFVWIFKMHEITSLYYNFTSYMEYILFPLIVSANLLTICSFAFKGVGFLYFDDDLNMLFSMPVKIHQIVLSKISLLVFCIIGVDIILIYPSVLFYGILNEVKLGYYVINFFNICFVMIIPSLIGIFLGLCIYRIIKLLESGNAKVKAIFEVVVLFLFICLIVFANSYKDNIINILQLVQDRTQFCINYFYEMFITQGKVVVWSWSLLFVIGSLALGFISISYQKITYILSLNDKKMKAFEIRSVKKRNPLNTLVVREKERFFSIPVYVLNTMLGIILLFIYILVMFFAHQILLSYATVINSSFGKDSITLGIINVFVITICIVLTNITSSSISIEGKRRMLLKAYPINAKQFFHAKIIFQLCLTIPIIIIANTIAIVVFRLKVIESILGYAVPIVFAVFSSLVGCLLNVCFPNYEWKNVAYIVKQSIASILSVFTNTGIVLISFFVICRYFIDDIILSLFVLFFGMLLINFIIISIFIFKSEKFYEKL